MNPAVWLARAASIVLEPVAFFVNDVADWVYQRARWSLSDDGGGTYTKNPTNTGIDT